MTDESNIGSFEERFQEARDGIEATGRIDPYDDQVLRTAYLGASALIDSGDLTPVEQITYRREIAELAGKLATEHSDDTTAAEMSDRVKDCDSILKLIRPEEEQGDAESGPDTPQTKPKSKRGQPPKASTSAAKTSGGKGN